MLWVGSNSSLGGERGHTAPSVTLVGGVKTVTIVPHAVALLLLVLAGTA
jgi:hypothetical protein